MRNTIPDLGRPEQLPPPASPARERRGADRLFEDELRFANRRPGEAAESPSTAAPRRDSLRESFAGDEVKAEESRQPRESLSRAPDAPDDAPAEDGPGGAEVSGEDEEGSTDGASEAAHDAAADALPSGAASCWASPVPTAPQRRGAAKGTGATMSEEAQAAAQPGAGVLAGATRPSRHRPGTSARGPEEDARAAPLDARAAPETAKGGGARADAARGNALAVPAALLGVLGASDPAAPPPQESPAASTASTAAGETPHAGSEQASVAPPGADDASLRSPSATQASATGAEHARGAPAQSAAPATPAGDPPAHASGPVRPAGEAVADGAVLRNAAHLRVEAPGVGELELHLRVLDGVAHLRVDGDAARAVEARAGELSRALAGEGLRLGNLEVRPAPASGCSTSGSGSGEAAPDGRRGADRHGGGADDGRTAHRGSPPVPPRPRAAHAPRSPGSRFGVRA